MTRSHNYSLSLSCIYLLALLSSCTTASKPQKFAMSFLPPAPKYTGVVHYEDVPKLESNPYLSETPKFFGELSKPPQPTQANTRVQRANERLEQRKNLYQPCDLTKA